MTGPGCDRAGFAVVVPAVTTMDGESKAMDRGPMPRSLARLVSNRQRRSRPGPRRAFESTHGGISCRGRGRVGAWGTAGTERVALNDVATELFAATRTGEFTFHTRGRARSSDVLQFCYGIPQGG